VRRRSDHVDEGRWNGLVGIAEPEKGTANANLGARLQRNTTRESRVARDQPVHTAEILDDGRPGLIELEARGARVGVGIVEDEVVRQPPPNGQRMLAEPVQRARATGVHYLENHRHEMRSR
jgi:hypothetical protein